MPQPGNIFESHNRSLIIISDEHEQLVDLLNVLDSAIGSIPEQPVEVAVQLKNIYKKMSEHFTHEEELMFEVGYPQYLEHQENHKYILGRITNLIAAYEVNSDDAGVKAKILIEQLMLTHLVEFDRALITGLSEKY